MRKVRVPIFDGNAVPFGRRADVLAALALASEDAARCAWKSCGSSFDSGDFLVRAASRKALALSVRMQERGGGRVTIRPLVPLRDGEGY
jgi:hypothetical protein